LLYNLRNLFNPVRQAAENSVQGATYAFDYAAQINESIAELKNVLYEISRSIVDVSRGAQDSSIQAEKIIGSIQISSDLVVELGEIAQSVYKSLDANQKNITEKINQVNLLSKNISESLETINQNADVAAKLVVQVAAFEEQMEGINSFLISMEEITEQTNLLALNASIEAARAEEHGKGFAVVAERIRNLSDETKAFTKQIKNTVSGIKTVAKEIPEALNNIISAVRSSASEVSEVNLEFSNLENVLQSLFSSNKAILQAADLQLDGTEQIKNRSLDILHAIQNITAQTEQVSASMEEISASSQEITSQIELISNKVAETKQVVERQLETAKLTKETTDHI
jgi:methyl-accepting chemotaxis protein